MIFFYFCEAFAVYFTFIRDILPMQIQIVLARLSLAPTYYIPKFFLPVSTHSLISHQGICCPIKSQSLLFRLGIFTSSSDLLVSFHNFRLTAYINFYMKYTIK